MGAQTGARPRLALRWSRVVGLCGKLRRRRAYAKAREQQNNLRLLHEITSLLYNSDDAPTALTDFLTAVRGAFRAASADIPPA